MSPTDARGASPLTPLTAAQRAGFASDGFVRIEGFAEPATGAAMLDRVVDLVHRSDAGEDVSPAFVMLESQADFAGRPIEDRVSKVFRLARDPVFLEFATRPEVVAPVRELLGTDDVSCFLSQFIFKNRGAWGQPWHQDSYYFPFDAGAPGRGRVARGHRGHARERVPPRPARLAPRAGARARARPAAGRASTATSRSSTTTRVRRSRC